MTDLIYNIESGLLKGRLGDLDIRAYAGSGGRSGSKQVNENIFLANNMLATKKLSKKISFSFYYQ